ncbi:hypothetical protein TPHA_0D02250 [Tetrapisispora phaffii CBS 4417]|uniref:Pre-rRNA-processing protein n=1 Tax=Tetrapisispora phaffii (strain ATCC 24235 / CBS 4417 / NBRC 1672 / NRRL Y-8282 / UCD 70-5) TaxID=1071381 RepID=G8BSP2_TETPH|nr:hypothetical protein TPHA_0D02250 [Tetrapisispora phaffii CBS 4417]CCE62863.1 hypothetical protein TPHA_0D02250 [Tetrapisispora phaffii CBS 4417]
MGNSHRKQKLKIQDFKKKKLKVGKPQDKPSNLTDASFSSRTINIKKQYLETNSDLSKRLPLLKHHNNTVRKETIQLFQKMLPKIINSTLLSPLITKSIPLICDESRQVREAYVEFIDEIGKINPQVLQLHSKIFVLYISMSMTHIVPSIQADSSKVLGVLLKYCGEEICKQSWTKLLTGLLSVLGWGTVGKNEKSSIAHTRKKDAKTTNIHLQTLCEFIRWGCTDLTALNEEIDEEGNSVIENIKNPYLISKHPNPYEFLRLFDKVLTNKNKNENNADNNKTNESNNPRDSSSQHLTDP